MYLNRKGVFVIAFLVICGCGGGGSDSSLGNVGSAGGNETAIPLENVQTGTYTASYQSPTMGGGNHDSTFSFTLQKSAGDGLQLTDWSSDHYVSTSDGGIRCYGGSESDSETELSIDVASSEFSITMSGGSKADIVIVSATEAQVTLTLYDTICENPMTVHATAVR